MKLNFALFLLVVLLFGCKQNDNEIAYFVSETESRCGEYIFEIDDNNFVAYPWQKDPIDISITSDGYYIASHRPRTRFIREVLPYTSQKLSHIEMANSHPEINYNTMDGWLYNVLVQANSWTVALYVAEGTYEFTINDQEQELFTRAIANIFENLDRHYFPAESNAVTRFMSSGALFAMIQENSVEREVFGTVWYEPCELSLLDQLTIVIIQKNISKENRISDEIYLEDIRNRFNYFMERDSVTGSSVYESRELYDELTKEGIIRKEYFQ